MTDKELKKIVTGFTKGILGNQSTAHKCYIVCSPLSTYLEFCGIGNKLTEGVLRFGKDEYHHFWITLKDGRIIDPTADQFNEVSGLKSPMVFVGQNPGYYIPYTKKMIDAAFKRAINGMKKDNRLYSKN